MRHTSLTKTALILLLAALLLITSCQSVPKNVSEDLTKEELIQHAQDSYEDGNRKAAEYYYNLVIERFPDDINSCIEAKFEIAHIFVKEGDYNKARPILEEIIASFDDPAVASSIPEYLKLAKLDLAKCE